MKKIGSIAILAILLVGLVSLNFTDDKYFDISKSFDIFAGLYSEVNKSYVDEVEPAKLMRTAIDAMMEDLDPYTNLISEAEIATYRMKNSGQYGGVGIDVFKKNQQVIIEQVEPTSSAYKAGVRPGDKLLTVDGKELQKNKKEEIKQMLMGAPDSDVSITIKKAITNVIETHKLTRTQLKIKAVPYAGMLNSDIGYVKLDQFSRVASKEISSSIQSLKSKGELKSLVLDLRGNPGGLLNEAVTISNFFVEKGQTVITTKGKTDAWNKTYKTPSKALYPNLPVVVLIDGKSASASEIVSGVLQDYDRGVVVGQTSYGKGLVQQTKKLTFNNQLKLTVAKYYTPSGRCIQAIDYSNRDSDGKPITVADSLRKKFYTTNGREVLDGKGVSPDVEVEKPKSSIQAKGLMKEHVVFDFVTQFYNRNEEIAKPSDFKLSDDEYEKFKTFAKSKKVDFNSLTLKSLDRLEKKTKDEAYFDAIENDMEEIGTILNNKIANNYVANKNELTKAIEKEIINRYYGKAGLVKASINVDDEIKEAIRILEDEATYNKILKGA